MRILRIQCAPGRSQLLLLGPLIASQPISLMSIMRKPAHLQSLHLPHLLQLILLQLILPRLTLYKSPIIGRRNVSVDECIASSSAPISFLHSAPPIGNRMKKFQRRLMKRLRRMRNSNQSLNECTNQLFPLLPIIQATTLLLIQM
jgi:hypothetical protein